MPQYHGLHARIVIPPVPRCVGLITIPEQLLWGLQRCFWPGESWVYLGSARLGWADGWKYTLACYRCDIFRNPLKKVKNISYYLYNLFIVLKLSRTTSIGHFQPCLTQTSNRWLSASIRNVIQSRRGLYMLGVSVTIDSYV
jgi:hypothetical protein